MKKLLLIIPIMFNLSAGQFNLSDGACTNSFKTDNDNFKRLKLAAEIENLLYFIEDNKLVSIIIFDRYGTKNIGKNDIKSLGFVNKLKQGVNGNIFYKIKSYIDRIESRISKLDVDVKSDTRSIKATSRDLDFLIRLESLLINIKNNVKDSTIVAIPENDYENFEIFINKMLANICSQYSNALKD